MEHNNLRELKNFTGIISKYSFLAKLIALLANPNNMIKLITHKETETESCAKDWTANSVSLFDTLTLWRSSFDLSKIASMRSLWEKTFFDCIFLWKTRSISPFPIDEPT